MLQEDRILFLFRVLDANDVDIEHVCIRYSGRCSRDSIARFEIQLRELILVSLLNIVGRIHIKHTLNET